MNFLDFENTLSSQLIIASAFPPNKNTSGNAMAKRVILSGNKVDVIQNNINNNLDNEFNEVVNEFINERIVIKSPMTFFEWDLIKKFVENGLKELKDRSYESIYSRAMFPASHFLAFEYKMIHPETFWTAEFSDPILFGIMGELREDIIDDEEYIEKIKKIIKEYNMDYKFVNNVEFLAECLPYLFADEIAFTNDNQLKYMLDYFPYPFLKEDTLRKSVVNKHPTLDKKYYYLADYEYELDDSIVNFAYFGIFYGNRTLEELFFAFESIDSIIQEKYQIHIFTHDINSFESSIDTLKIKDKFVINSYVPFLDFLNLSTKFDCLIVNDAYTKPYKDINPYLPSKISDYLGSGTNIWAICEKNSTMDKLSLDYKSYLGDYLSNKVIVEKIILDVLKSKNIIVDFETDQNLYNHYNFPDNRFKDFNESYLSVELTKNVDYLDNRIKGKNIEIFDMKLEINNLKARLNILQEDNNKVIRNLSNENKEYQNKIKKYRNKIKKQNGTIKKLKHSKLNRLKNILGKISMIRRIINLKRL